jgi:formylglycine-generating enzyme required for sulfatase activity
VSVVASSGCSATPKGSLMLSMSTDMQTPKDVDVVSVFIETDGVAKFDYLGRVLPDGTLLLPSTLALVQPDNPNAQVHIRVTAFQTQGTQENARVLRDVLTTVPTARTALLRLPLDFLDDGSGQGVLQPQYVPEGVDSAPDGLTEFDPTTIASSCDPMQLCKTGNANCQTMVNGVCGAAVVESSTLPTYADGLVFGDGGTAASPTCFDVQGCFAGATPIAGVGGRVCSFTLPGSATGSSSAGSQSSSGSTATLNFALVTQSAGACLVSGGCYVPLPNDPKEGWTLQGNTVQLAQGVCNKLGSTVTLAMSSGTCATDTTSQPVCEPTGADAGEPLVDATTQPDASAEGGLANASPDASIDATTVASTDASPDAPTEASDDAGGCAASDLASSWDVTADFSTATNPSCVWSYGYTETLGSTPFILFTQVLDQLPGVPSWLDPTNETAYTPSLLQNLSGSTVYGVAPGQVSENPGPNGEYATARWTAPAAGTYSFAVQFFAGDTGIKNGAVLHGSAVLFQQSPATDPTFSTTLTMAAGDTFDVATGLTAGETFNNGNTPIAEVITRVTTGTSNPSCAPGGAGTTNCGSASESCCTSLEVIGGTFDRTYDPAAADGGIELAADGGPTGEADPATVSGFQLDKYLVTVGRFRQFVNAWNGGAGYTPPAGSGIHTHLNEGQGLVVAGAATGDGGVEYETGWNSEAWSSQIAPTDTNLASCGAISTWTTTAGTQESLPINCVSWYEAYAFCIWDGGFLPSSAEWEYAAAGGSLQREFPWGSTDPGMGTQYAIHDCYYGPGNCSNETVAIIAPVGTATLGVGQWGQLDMAGEVVEWTLDYQATLTEPCADCASLTPGVYRLVRGGQADSDDSWLVPTWSFGIQASGRDSPGVRCARTP